MINLAFTINREPVRFTIADKKIRYFDRKWKDGIDFMPKNVEIVMYLLTNQRKFPLASQIVGWINEANSGNSLEQYNACTTDEEVAEIVKRDAKSNGLLEVV